jgi:cyclohexyl-isocyanide hydratase
MSPEDLPIPFDADRRRLLSAMALAAAGSGLAAAGGAHAAETPHDMPVNTMLPGPKPKVAMLVYPRMVLLDLVGPQTVLNISQCEIHLVGKTKAPCITEVGVPITPTTTFADCPKDLDVLFVPGGILGTTDCMNDPETLAFLADRGARARYVTSVCTGALVLGAAGLLRGYRAATLWAVTDILPLLGAIPSTARVEIDRNRMTGGGVTAGLDFGLVLAARLRNEEIARRTQLTIEYSPQPPFKAGTPTEAGPELTAKIKAGRVGMDGNARKAALAAAARFT